METIDSRPIEVRHRKNFISKKAVVKLMDANQPNGWSYGIFLTRDEESERKDEEEKLTVKLKKKLQMTLRLMDVESRSS